MSYCRWSSDSYRCDLYCYADIGGGFATHVAARRRIGIEMLPPEPDPMTMPSQDFVDANEAWLDALHALPMVAIGLPFDGATFNDPTPAAFKARLLTLRAAGYRFPDSVLDRVDDEIAEAAQGMPRLTGAHRHE